MAQQAETVQVVQSYDELKALTRKELQDMVKQFKAEDTDCLSNVNGKSKNEDLVAALADYMGFTPTDAEDGDNKPQEDQSDVMAFGDDVPTLQTELFEETQPQAEPDPVIAQIMAEEEVTKEEAEEINADNLADMAKQDANWAEQVANQTPSETVTEESTGDSDVDALLADLGLDGINVIDLGGISFDTPPQDTPPNDTPQNAPQNEPIPHANVPNDENAPQNAPQGEEKPKKKRSTLSFEDKKRIPIRKYRDYTLGMYGDILQRLDEPDKHGYNYDVLKLERFNSKAHEIFRKTKGHMHLVYTNVGSAYMIVYKQPDGTFEPVLEVTNKGRGHLQSKQLANVMQVAYNEKNDQETISAEQYQSLVEQIELLPINAESAGA